REGCVNPNGRTEFDPVKVKAHVQETRLRANRELGVSWSQMTTCPDRQLPEEHIDSLQSRLESSACDYSSEGSDNSSVCSENSDYASSDEIVTGTPASVSVTGPLVLTAKDQPTAPANVNAKDEPSEDSGNGGTSVDSVPP
ncbi:hypothetical protein BIW11_14295, partial [Tropilaelaps mercedesae]